VSTVAAAKMFRRMFEDENTRARLPRRDGCTQSGIAAADYEHVKHFVEINHSKSAAL